MPDTVFTLPAAQQIREFTYLRNATHTRAFLVAGVEQHVPPDEAHVYLYEFGGKCVKRKYTEVQALIQSHELQRFTPAPMDVSEINKKNVA